MNFSKANVFAGKKKDVKKNIINNQNFITTQGSIVLQKDMKCPLNQEHQKASTAQHKFD